MKRNRGFTLVELIIVVIIIGILATIAIPQYMRAVARARGGKARSALGMIIQAEKMSIADLAAFCGSLAAGGCLDTYVEMADINSNLDFTYTITGTTAAYTANAAANPGRNAGTGNITLSNNGTWGGTWAP